MLVRHEKRCSTATHTISGGADIQYERTGNNDNSDFAGKGRGHTVESSHSRTANHSETKQT